MNGLTRKGAKKLYAVLILSNALALAACTGGGGGGGGGGSQDPDPVVVDLAIAYIKRPVPLDPDETDPVVRSQEITEPDAFNPGAALFVRDRASPSADERNVTDRAWPEGALYDVKDLEASYDGQQLVFAMRAPDDPDLDEDEQAKWDIWVYDLPSDQLQRVLVSESVAQRGHDVAPHFLPDGGIVFSSDRQQRTRAILLDDGKPQYSGITEDNARSDELAFVLHRMDDDGNNLTQLTYNQSHDLQPTVLQDGRVLFLRWDRYNNDNFSLYTINPNGTNLQFHYGFHSQDTGTNDIEAILGQPREMPDGRILVNLRPRDNEVRLGGDMIAIDTLNFTENDQPVAANAGAEGPAQDDISVLDVFIDSSISPHGYFNQGYPLFDGTPRLLVSWNQCRLVNPDDLDPDNPTPFDAETVRPCSIDNLASPDALEALPLFGIWIYDIEQETQLPIVLPQENVLHTEVVALEPRDLPFSIVPGVNAPLLNQNDMANDVGVVHIRSVYDFDGMDMSGIGIDQLANPSLIRPSERPARFLQLVKAVSQPPLELLEYDTEAFGRGGNGQRMREILGYVPIEPDGSVKFRVPADVSFTFNILDAQGIRLNGVERHQNWLHVGAGETLECNGCHTSDSEAPHGRVDAEAASANPGAPTQSTFPGARLDVGAMMGETMAETFSRVTVSGTLSGEPRTPSVDIEYTDFWSPAGMRDPDDDISFRYADLDASLTPPTSDSCIMTWAANCRITINYPDHIQQLWELPRLSATNTDATCTTCHGITDAMGATMVPNGQLDLRGVIGNPNPVANENNRFRTYLASFIDLMAGDTQVTVNGGNLVRVMVPRLDGNGQEIPILDANGDQVIIDGVPQVEMTTVPVQRSMNPAGVARSQRFFARFREGSGNANHEGLLSEAELKLISEWIEIGAQYYNNPFDAPLN